MGAKLPHFPLPHIPPLQFGAAYSTPVFPPLRFFYCIAFYTAAFSIAPDVHILPGKLNMNEFGALRQDFDF